MSGRFIQRLFLRNDGVLLDDLGMQLTQLPTAEEAASLRPFAKNFVANDEFLRRGALSAATYAAADRLADDRASASFLQQATLGPTIAEIQAATALGSRRAWIQDQFTRTFPRRFMDHAYTVLGLTNFEYDGTYRAETHNTIATMLLQSNCALRAKCLHALTKLFVISLPGGAFDDHGRLYSFVSWYDRLDKYVFGNWRDLIESITYSLHMSRMLTFYANEKETGNNQPDENYAREIMQLFSIGLHELNMDGTYKLDADGKRIPTYTNDDIRQVARCMTGLTRWDFNNTTQRYDLDDATSRARAREGMNGGNGPSLFGDPDTRLVHYLPFYEYGSKVALKGRINIPAGTDPVTNLRMLHDALFNHPNTAPFFAQRMIQHLVTSNPSPAYVARVAAAFNDNGAGVRGDLKAVWLAILTDPEAASDGRYDKTFGRVRDGFDLWCNVMRSFDRKNSAGRVAFYRTGDVSTWIANLGPMAPIYAPSIFGGYDPLHSPTELNTRGLLAPELQQWNGVLLARAANELINIIDVGEPGDTASLTTAISDYSMLPLTGTAADLIERVNLLMCGGHMGPALRASLQSLVGSLPTGTTTEQHNRVAVLLQVVTASPDFWVQF